MNYRRYTVIQGWMLDLGLDLTETVIYAVIFGFSQGESSVFDGSWKYLAEMAKCSKRKVSMTLPKLVEMGLLKKIDVNINGVKFCKYKAHGGDASGALPMQEIHGGDASGAPNNKYINKESKDSLSLNARAKFQKPSIEEVDNYCKERNNNVCAENFVNFYESKGWMIGKSPMKDWKAAVRTWEKRGSTAQRQTSRPAHRESTFERNMKEIDKMFGTNVHEQMYGGQQNE